MKELNWIKLQPDSASLLSYCWGAGFDFAEIADMFRKQGYHITEEEWEHYKALVDIQFAKSLSNKPAVLDRMSLGCLNRSIAKNLKQVKDLKILNLLPLCKALNINARYTRCVYVALNGRLYYKDLSGKFLGWRYLPPKTMYRVASKVQVDHWIETSKLGIL